MTKVKRKLTPAEKSRKKKRQMECMTIFINGKQKRVKRPPTIDGIELDDFIQRNADPAWLHQNELWEEIDSEEPEEINDLPHPLDERRLLIDIQEWSPKDGTH